MTYMHDNKHSIPCLQTIMHIRPCLMSWSPSDMSTG